MLSPTPHRVGPRLLLALALLLPLTPLSVGAAPGEPPGFPINLTDRGEMRRFVAFTSGVRLVAPPPRLLPVLDAQCTIDAEGTPSLIVGGAPNPRGDGMTLFCTPAAPTQADAEQACLLLGGFAVSWEPPTVRCLPGESKEG